MVPLVLVVSLILVVSLLLVSVLLKVLVLVVLLSVDVEVTELVDVVVVIVFVALTTLVDVVIVVARTGPMTKMSYRPLFRFPSKPPEGQEKTPQNVQSEKVPSSIQELKKKKHSLNHLNHHFAHH